MENDKFIFDRICNTRFFERRVAMTGQLANKRWTGGTKDMHPP